MDRKERYPVTQQGSTEVNMRSGFGLVSGLLACALILASSAAAQIDSSYQRILFGIQYDHRLFVTAECRGGLIYEDMQAHGYKIPRDSFVALGPQDSTWAECRPPIDSMIAVICGEPIRLHSIAIGAYWNSGGTFAPEPLQCLLEPSDSLNACDALFFLIFRDGAPFDRKVCRYKPYNPPVPRRLHKHLTTLQSLALSYAQKTDSLIDSNHDLKLDIFSPSDSTGTGPLYAFVYRTVKTKFTWSVTQVMILRLWQSNVQWEIDELRTWEQEDGPIRLECTLDVDGDQEAELMVQEIMGATVYKVKLGRLETLKRAYWISP